MARTDTRYRMTFNRLLGLCRTLGPKSRLPSELMLAAEMNVSRTVVRSALQTLDERGIIRWEGREKCIIREPDLAERLSLGEETISPEELERRFLDWILRFDVPPGTALNVTQLSKRFSVAPHTLQEFLASLSRFGLVERRSRGGWRLLGFTLDFAVELSDFRMMIELNAVQHLVGLPSEHPIWRRLDAFEARHHALLTRLETDFHDFSQLDGEFHVALCGVVKNRFADEFQKVISLIFHYHYQWEKAGERDRNEAAIGEHLKLIDALRSGEPERALSTAREHLATSRETLLASLKVHNFT